MPWLRESNKSCPKCKSKNISVGEDEKSTIRTYCKDCGALELKPKIEKEATPFVDESSIGPDGKSQRQNQIYRDPAEAERFEKPNNTSSPYVTDTPMDSMY